MYIGTYLGGWGRMFFLKGVKESSDLSTVLTSGQAETSSGDREKVIVSSFITEAAGIAAS